MMVKIARGLDSLGMKYIAVCGLLIGPAVAMAQQPSTAAAKVDTIAQAAQLAVESNPEVQARWHAFLASAEDRSEVKGGYLPSVDLTALAGRANREFDSRGNYGRGQAEVSLTQMLFDGFRVSSQLARADHTRLVRYYELLDAVQGKALEVAASYEDVNRYREMVRLAKLNYANHMRVYKQISARADSGVGNQADLEQISGRRSLAEVNLLTETANLHDASARFMRLVGRVPSLNMAPVSTMKSDAIPVDLAKVLGAAYAGNPAFHATFESVTAAQASIGERKASRYPRLELRARYGVHDNMNGFDSRSNPDERGEEGVVELGLNYNLFRGGSDRAAERAANLRVAQAEDLRLKACIDLRQTASIAWNDYYNLREKLVSLKSHRDGSALVVKAYRDQFDIGRRSLLDVLDSENEAFQSERAYAHGQFDRQVSYYRTLTAMGQLLPALGVARDGLPTADELGGEDLGERAQRVCSATGVDASADAASVRVNEDEGMQRFSGNVINLAADALFASGSSIIDSGGERDLSVLAAKLNASEAESQITITGHTDSSGTEATNMPLSLARAVAVRDYLVAAGVNSALIVSKGAAASQPIASNATVAGRASNRRVEVVISSAK